MTVKEIIAMDGRKRAPLPASLWPRPRFNNTPRISVTSVRTTIAAFERTGSTTHSATGTTLGYVVAYCVENNIPFRLQSRVYDGQCSGYFIEKIKSPNA